MKGTSGCEWYTPAWVIEAARSDGTTGCPVTPSMALCFGIPMAEVTRHFGPLGTILTVA